MTAKIVLENQFGETSDNYILDSDGTVPATQVAAGTIIANLTGGSAFPSANTLADVAAALPASAITAKALTGLAAGTNAVITSSDTILQALAKLQAQISAL